MREVDSILTSIFHLESFRPQQREIVNDVLAGRDTLVVMPTGAGKSLCYQLPAVALRGLTLIISPLISLMTDQVRQLRSLRIPAMMLSSGQSWEQQREVMARMRDGFRGLLYVAPERFNAPGFQAIITQRQLSLLAIDEAHCISQWGHDFRPEYLKLGEVRHQLGDPLTIALTATATPEVREDIARTLRLKNPAIHVTGFDRPNLSYQSVVFVKARNKQDELIDYIKRRKDGGIVYCSTRKQVEMVTDLLAEKLRGRHIVAYHAGMDSEARQSNQRRFIDHDDAIVVATNAFGMGINKPNLRYVIHYNVPGSLEAYYQEAGRAGRDGLPAECILYFAPADVMTQKFFIDKIGEGNEKLTAKDIKVLTKRANAQLNAMQNYARWERCRRRQILEYFGENKLPENCNCDVCRASTPSLRVTTRELEYEDEDAAPRRSRSTKSSRRSATPVRSRSMEEAIEPVALSAEDARMARLKDLRRDVVRSLGTVFFQHLPDDLLHRLIESPPQTIAALADDFDVHEKVVENFGRRILYILSAKEAEQPMAPKLGAPRLAMTTRVLRERPTPHAKVRASEAKVVASKEVAGGKVGARHGGVVEARFERLRTLRLELARKHHFPPFCVLQDATLLEIARARPRNLRELGEIKGVGPKRVERYGEALLAELAKE